MMKKTISRIRAAALLLLLAMLVACTGKPMPDTPLTGDGSNKPSESGTDSSNPLEKNDLCISGNTYTLIRPERSSDNLLASFLLISNGLKELQGTRFPIGTDYVADGSEIPQKNPEILLGNTNRRASSEVLQTLGEAEWAVTIVGSQIVITGTDELAIRQAAEYFISVCKSKNGAVYVPNNLNMRGSRNGTDNSGKLPLILPDSQTQLLVTSSDGRAYTPEWVNDLIIMEANLANSTPEGTLEAARRVVDHVARMGVNGLWITPIGQRTGQHFYGNLGLHTIDSTLTGTTDYAEGWERFTDFVGYAHSKNVRIFLDVVTWGTATGSPLYTEHPDWYTGKEEWSGLAFDWNSAELREWYTQTAVDLIMQTGIDGLRCDCEPDYAGYELFADIRERCLANGRKIIIFSEHSNSRDGAFDFEQLGVFDYSVCSFSDQQEKKLNWLMRNTSIISAIRNSNMIGSTQKEIQNKTAYYRYFTYCVSCHDFSGTAVKRNILTLAYQALFAPFIPIWYLGEEFGWNGSGSLLYTKVDWKDAEDPENNAFMEQVKQMIAIRRDYADVFSVFAENHREANICAVRTSGLGSLTAYARYNSNRAILIIPNVSGSDRSGTVTVPFSSAGLDSSAAWQIRDLLTGKVLATGTGTEIADFTVNIPNNGLGVYLIEPLN